MLSFEFFKQASRSRRQFGQSTYFWKRILEVYAYLQGLSFGISIVSASLPLEQPPDSGV
jgi:hypothetical protein